MRLTTPSLLADTMRQMRAAEGPTPTTQGAAAAQVPWQESQWGPMA